MASFSRVAGFIFLKVTLFDELVHFPLMINLYSSIMIPLMNIVNYGLLRLCRMGLMIWLLAHRAMDAGGCRVWRMRGSLGEGE